MWAVLVMLAGHADPASAQTGSPHHADTLRDLSVRSGPPWQARVGATVDIFPDRDAWVETHISIGRDTPIGAIAVRGARAERFGITDKQLEIEMAPRIGRGTWLYVAAAVARDTVLYPGRRYAIDGHQCLGERVEGSLGFRRVGFGDGVDIYTGALSVLAGNWIVAGRLFHTPSEPDRSRSIQASVRRYLGSRGSYLGVTYGHGAWPDELRTVNDLEVFDSDVGGIDAALMLNDRLDLRLGAAIGRQDRVDRGNVRQYSLTIGLGARF